MVLVSPGVCLTLHCLTWLIKYIKQMILYTDLRYAMDTSLSSFKLDSNYKREKIKETKTK